MLGVSYAYFHTWDEDFRASGDHRGGRGEGSGFTCTGGNIPARGSCGHVNLHRRAGQWLVGDGLMGTTARGGKKNYVKSGKLDTRDLGTMLASGAYEGKK